MATALPALLDRIGFLESILELCGFSDFVWLFVGRPDRISGITQGRGLQWIPEIEFFVVFEIRRFDDLRQIQRKRQIIELAALGIGEDLVRQGYFLEMEFRLLSLIRVPVWMPFLGEFSVCLPNDVIRGVWCHV